SVPPIAITFSRQAPPGVEHFDAPLATPAEDGRTGRVPAGCVFWMKAVDRTFTTVAEDHRNCSVGTLTHGFAPLEDVAGNADVAAMLAADWVTADVMPEIPTVRDNPGTVTYGPLRDTSVDPDVVLLRISPAQLMVLSDAVPDLHIGGKPQCHIIALAKEHDTIAASTGCALSRERTRMSPNEMTAALPGARVAEVVERLRATTAADKSVAFYAAHDSRRFPS
ncbi:MAG TPA: DUF169 domain-containing protein, partial [Vicinamibacterales bacterium]|nr:DUF169 domain-containing protein [Vicinamibacterales bacterium]